MQFIDTHTHLYTEEFDDDRMSVINNALQKDISNFVIPAIDSTYSEAMDRLKSAYPDNMHLMAGLHPTYVKAKTVTEELEQVEKRLQQGGFCAVGEIGIDLYWDKTTLDLQIEAFKKQISWAKKYSLPIVIHCRDAFDEVFKVLESERGPDLRGIFHCFTGNVQQARQALDLNLMLGIGGIVTFKNAGLDDTIGQIKLEHVVLETDAPYLAPSPFRGKRNESAHLIYVAERLSEIYDVPLKKIAEQTTANAKYVFNL